MDVVLVGVPFDGWGRPGNQARAAHALREAGLREAFAGRHRVHSAPELALPAPDPRRGSTTSLVNELALVEMVQHVGSPVRASVEQGQFPVVYGGDCTTLLGIVPQVNQGRRTGLVFIDGHEDTMPLDVSTDGEAANTELGLLLGISGRLMRGPLQAAVGSLERTQLGLLGQRDDEWRAQHNIGSLGDLGVWTRPWRYVAEAPDVAAREAVGHVLKAADGYWLHVDLDVLDPEELASQGVPGVADTPGGLSWDQLRAVLTTAVSVSPPLGLSIAIYDPDQDPDGNDAAQIVAALASLAQALADHRTA
jgi:arginase